MQQRCLRGAASDPNSIRPPKPPKLWNPRFHREAEVTAQTLAQNPRRPAQATACRPRTRSLRLPP
eukprot:11184665-Lingulodinium_polyedra.AAC.1